MKLSVVVRCCTSKDEVFELFDSLSRQTLVPDEIVLIDSGSSPEVLARLRQLNHRGLAACNGTLIPVPLIHIKPEEFQSARALNQAIAHSRGELVAIISQDAVPADEHYLANLVSAFDDPKIAGAYARQILRDHYCPFGEKDLFNTYPPKSRVQAAPECWFVNTCSMVRRSLWEQHPFDEQALISEDHEWGKWAQSQEYLLKYQADAVAKHYHVDSLGKLWTRHYEEGRGLLYIHGTRESMVHCMLAYLRETASDTLWLTRKLLPQYIPVSFARRFVKHAAFYFGGRSTPPAKTIESPNPRSA